MNVKKLLKNYFIAVSILAHCLIIVMLGVWLSHKVTESWRWPIIKRWFLGDVDKSRVFPLVEAGYQGLPKGRWVKIHQQKPEDQVFFTRQEHAGSGFDALNSRLYIFGSNTHGEDWNNAVYWFDLDTLTWSQSYQPDSPDTYSVNSQGVPVAGKAHNHPWAMHTFAAIAFDKLHRKLVVASYPGHLSPDRYGQSLAHLWRRIKKQPTWLYDPGTNQWQSYDGKAEQFFPYAMIYDSDRGVITGFKPNGIYDWQGRIFGWKKIGDRAMQQWHTNGVYDSVNHVFIFYGGNAMKNSVYVYKAGDKAVEKMPTLGLRPPGGQSMPLTFHKRSGRMVALIDTENQAQTWLYDYKSDSWQRLEADFPYPVGMNYTMEYDIRRDVVVLVSSPADQPVAVWVLKL